MCRSRVFLMLGDSSRVFKFRHRFLVSQIYICLFWYYTSFSCFWFVPFMVCCYTSFPCILVTSFRNFLELRCNTSCSCISVAPFRDFLRSVVLYKFSCIWLYTTVCSWCYTSLSCILGKLRG